MVSFFVCNIRARKQSTDKNHLEYSKTQIATWVVFLSGNFNIYKYFCTVDSKRKWITTTCGGSWCVPHHRHVQHERYGRNSNCSFFRRFMETFILSPGGLIRTGILQLELQIRNLWSNMKHPKLLGILGNH